MYLHIVCAYLQQCFATTTPTTMTTTASQMLEDRVVMQYWQRTATSFRHSIHFTPFSFEICFFSSFVVHNDDVGRNETDGSYLTKNIVRNRYSRMRMFHVHTKLIRFTVHSSHTCILRTEKSETENCQKVRHQRETKLIFLWQRQRSHSHFANHHFVSLSVYGSMWV